MNLSKTFGAVLSIIGLVGVIYGGYLMMRSQFDATSLVPVTLGLILLFAGISLLKKNE